MDSPPSPEKRIDIDMLRIFPPAAVAAFIVDYLLSEPDNFNLPDDILPYLSVAVAAAVAAVMRRHLKN